MPAKYVDYSRYDESVRYAHAIIQAALAAGFPAQRDDLSPAAANIRGVGYARGLCVFVENAADEGDVRRALIEEHRVPQALLADPELEIVVAGQPTVTATRYRPVPGGCSGSNLYGEAGTLGCLTWGLSGTWGGTYQILGNNHILARNNAGQVGDPVIQPGAGEGGGAGDQVATLAQWVTTWFQATGRTNYMDAATAYVANTTLVTAQVLGIPHTTTNAALAYTGMPVQKSGAVSGLRSAAVLATGVATWINAGTPQNPLWAWYADQIVAGEEDLLFQASGDSGALLWTTANPAQPVALAFAGGTYNAITFCAYASPISWVLDALNLQIVPY